MTIGELRKIWTEPGQSPEYHYKQQQRLKDEWPMLYDWIQRALNPPAPVNQIVRHDNSDMEMAEYLLKLVQINLPFVKRPSHVSMCKWADAINKLHRIDGYDYRIIRAVIDWAVEDEFWQANIRSAPKLREKFETLLAQIKREQGGKSLI